jgi:hypothetical protein
MKTILALTALALLAQGEKKSNPGYESIKKLEGEWESSDKDHPCKVSYKSGSGGSIVTESMSMANHAEMLTVYHPDGDGLALTHYCMLGNQPHMKAEKESKAGTLRFVCDGGSNLKCAGDKHMHSLTVTFVDADHLKQEWAMFDGGKEQMIVTINLARKKA